MRNRLRNRLISSAAAADGPAVSGVNLARVALRAVMEQARKNGGGRKAKSKPTHGPYDVPGRGRGRARADGPRGRDRRADHRARAVGGHRPTAWPGKAIGYGAGRITGRPSLPRELLPIIEIRRDADHGR